VQKDTWVVVGEEDSRCGGGRWWWRKADGRGMHTGYITDVVQCVCVALIT